MPAKKKTAAPKKKASASKKKPAKKKAAPAAGESEGSTSIRDIAAELNTQFKFAMFKTGEDELLSEVKEWVSTGCDLLDIVLGGGFPVGRITEIFGKKASGKSTICQQALAQVQKAGGLGIMLDTEKALDQERAKWLGVDLKELVHQEPHYLEDAFEGLVRFIKKVRETDQLKGKPILVVWDTMIYTPSKLEKDEKTGELRYDGMVGAQKAKILHQIMGHLLDHVARSQVAFVFVNHTTEKIGAFFPGQYSKAGGSAPDYATSLQLHVKANNSQDAKIMEGDEQVGNGMRFDIVKSRHGSKRQVNARLNWFTGVDNAGTMLDFLKDRNIARREGNRYYIKSSEGEIVITSGEAGEKAFREKWEESEQFRRDCIHQAKTDIYSVIPWKKQSEPEPHEEEVFDREEFEQKALADLKDKGVLK